MKNNFFLFWKQNKKVKQNEMGKIKLTENILAEVQDQ